MLIEEIEDGENKSKYLLEELIKSNHRCLTLQYICDDQDKQIQDLNRRIIVMDKALARAVSSLLRIARILG